jgi:hypothetical protein
MPAQFTTTLHPPDPPNTSQVVHRWHFLIKQNYQKRDFSRTRLFVSQQFAADVSSWNGALAITARIQKDQTIENMDGYMHRATCFSQSECSGILVDEVIFYKEDVQATRKS